MLDKSFQKILYGVDNWIIEGSSWVIASINAEYVTISACSSLSGSTYIELLCGLRISMKGLINIKNCGNRCFLWCRIRHLHSLKIHSERKAKWDKGMGNDLD